MSRAVHPRMPFATAPTSCFNCGAIITHSLPTPSPTTSAENLRTTNNPPSDSDRGAFRKELKCAQASLVDVSDKIIRLEENLALLREEKQRLSAAVETYKIILNPVRILPDDVLREIFEICSAPVEDMMARVISFTNSLDPRKPPWTLGQVCRRWRSVTACSSSLWTSIGIVLVESQPSERLNGDIYRLVQQVQRVGNRPVCITLKAEESITKHHPLLLIASSHSTRWETLYIAMPYETLQLIDPLIKGNLPLLKRLRIDVPSMRSDYVGCIDAFQHAPQLRSVGLLRAPTNLKLQISMPWAQITSYRDLWWKSWRPASTTSPIVQEMSNLTHLFASHWIVNNYPRITLLHLHTLHLDGQHIEQLGENSTFLDGLDIPRLRNLYLSWLPDSHAEMVKRFMQRSASTLRAVHIGRRLSSCDVRKILEAIPSSVERFALHDNMDDSDILSALTLKREVSGHRPQNNIPRCYNLRLYISEGYSWRPPVGPIASSALLAMVKSRLPPEVEPEFALRKFTICGDPRSTRWEEARHELVNGLDIEGLEVDYFPPEGDSCFPDI
ncbi:hypothetical protein VNI00_000890 [Paramarasmius palmivorus]|uniref:F-box domain-containing protein n=1 Tax=Paramarasmius palmivorus TaxID=297713 RepID=A0AAW0E9H3_9AGAR